MATFTEFYCQSGGSNLNAGSSTNNTAEYTSTNGGFNSGTGVFTPTDGSTPASSVNVGDFASVYIDGASIAVCCMRVTAVGAGVNGTITVTTSGTGSVPSTNASARSIKVGGAWLGPNAASGFPFTLTNFGFTTDASSHNVRLNLKNDQTYSLTSSFGLTGVSSKLKIVQGYTSSLGDGGKATFDGGTSTGSLISSGGTAYVMLDLIFATSITTGSANLVTADVLSTWIRCVFHGARASGFLANVGPMLLYECEAYDCNKSNTSATGAFQLDGASLIRCIAHDNTGSNTSGFRTIAGPSIFSECISDTNGGHGIFIAGSASFNGTHIIENCDIYNNGGDGINIITGQIQPVVITNTNLIKNTGAGINNVSTLNYGQTYNCGYGAGTQANGSSDTLNNFIEVGKVTYASNATPWVDPANGDFSVSLSTAVSTGRGTFTQTAASYSGTIGYPDIGAAQALVVGSGGHSTCFGM